METICLEKPCDTYEMLRSNVACKKRSSHRNPMHIPSTKSELKYEVGKDGQKIYRVCPNKKGFFLDPRKCSEKCHQDAWKNVTKNITQMLRKISPGCEEKTSHTSSVASSGCQQASRLSKIVFLNLNMMTFSIGIGCWM